MAEETDANYWHVDMEVNLFHAMRGHKPVGVNRFFQMMIIHNKLNNTVEKKIPSDEIWRQLKKMYDLQALNESEIVPFPNKKTDFLLPPSDFGDLMTMDYPRMPKTPVTSTLEQAKSDTSTPTPKQSGKATSSSSALNTPEASPKRKRTRNTVSTPTSANSTPEAPPNKRRR